MRMTREKRMKTRTGTWRKESDGRSSIVLWSPTVWTNHFDTSNPSMCTTKTTCTTDDHVTPYFGSSDQFRGPATVVLRSP